MIAYLEFALLVVGVNDLGPTRSDPFMHSDRSSTTEIFTIFVAQPKFKALDIPILVRIKIQLGNVYIHDTCRVSKINHI